MSVNADKIRQAFEDLPSQATPFVTQESGWEGVALDATPLRPTNATPPGSGGGAQGTPSRSPAAATLEAAATLTPSRLPRDGAGRLIATSELTPERAVAAGRQLLPGSPRPADTADLANAKAEVRKLKASLVKAEQETNDASTTAELLHAELETCRAELLKACEEAARLRASSAAQPAPSPAAATSSPEKRNASGEAAEELLRMQDKVEALEAALEAADAQVLQLQLGQDSKPEAQEPHASPVAAAPPTAGSPASDDDASAATRKVTRLEAETSILRTEVNRLEVDLEVSSKENDLLRRQLSAVRGQRVQDISSKLEAEDRALEEQRAELHRLQLEADAVEERIRLRRGGLEAAESDKTAVTGGPSGTVPSSTGEALATIDLQQERSRNQWLEGEVQRLKSAAEADRSFFESQLEQFADDSSTRLRRQKQSARLERMRSGTPVVRHAWDGTEGKHSVHKRYLRLSECGTRLLWGRSAEDKQLVAVAVSGIE
eukprot:COSAG04_NODE_229_length_19247_cov_7.166910_11_plen_491_part_00